MKSLKNILYVAFFLLWHPWLGAQSAIFSVNDDYVDRHDIVYKTPAYEGYEGFPLGNGDLGGMIWNNKNGLEIQVNKNDLFDKPGDELYSTLRNGARISVDLGAPAFEWLYLKDFDGRLSLNHAEANFKAITPFRTTVVNSWVAHDKNIWVVKIQSKDSAFIAGGTPIRIDLEQWGSRTMPGWYGRIDKNYEAGIGKTQTKTAGNNIVLEQELKGLRYTIACGVVMPGSDVKAEIISNHRAALITPATDIQNLTLVISMATSYETENPTARAMSLLHDFMTHPIEESKKQHDAWWRSFWNRSFVHLDNDYIENIYYFRRYLMASSSRGRFPVVFNGGLWNWNHDLRNWVTPHHWNTQQQYWGLCPSGDQDLLLPYINTYFRLMPYAEEHAKLRGADNAILWSEPHDFLGSMTFWNRDDMINNFTPASQIAGFFWEYYQFTLDKNFLREKAYPFMKKAAEFYVKKLQWDSIKQQYFIYPSQPYESPESNSLLNPTTDRNMIVSLFKNCREAAAILKLDKNKIEQWKHITDHLWPLPVRNIPGVGNEIALAYDKDGTMYPSLKDRSDQLFHFSANTSIVFPAGIIGIDNKGEPLFDAVVNILREHSPYRNAISPDPIVAARVGMGDRVLLFMQNGIRRQQHFPQGLFYNIDHWWNLSLYKDSVKQPDITTQRDYIYDRRTHYPNSMPAQPFVQCGLEPLSIYGAATNEMLLQSNEDKIRIFPAVPRHWAVSFSLKARNGFKVSSLKEKDQPAIAVEILSELGQPCRLEMPWPGEAIAITNQVSGRSVKFKIENNVIEFQTTPGTSYLIQRKNERTLAPVIFESEPNNNVKKFYEAQLGMARNF